jgi:ATP-dependent Clp protease ATP-binding subunit ClpA
VFERFTTEARQVVVAAQEEARHLGADQVAPAHLLLALAAGGGPGGQLLRATGLDHDRVRTAVARSGGPLDADALAALGVDLDSVRAAAEAAFGPGALDPPARAGHIGFAGGSRRTLEEALRTAVRRKDRRLDTGHLLAGVLAVGDPVVDRVLGELGTDPRELRDRAEGDGEVA